MNVAFATLGCKVNHYETQAMRALFEAAGFAVVPFSSVADVYVVNTCTVTGMSDSKSRRLIARAHKRSPDALIAAVGCYAQSDAQAVAALPGVGLVLGTIGRSAIVGRVQGALAARAANRGAPPTRMDRAAGEADALAPALSFVTDAREARAFEPLNAVRDGRTRATLKIQDGCANHCAYCIIPHARGPVRSRTLADTRAQLEALAAKGYREIVLTGIHLASYGRDLGDCDLLDALSLTQGIDGLARVRLGSLEPGFVDERFVRAVTGNEKICRQFHLSLQSGSDGVLFRMRRRYTTAEYARAASLLRAAMPDCAVTTDVIAGFCGETEAEHADSLAFVEQMQFARIHVFPFSVRRGTPAAAMPGQLPNAVREARARELIALGARLTHAFLTAQLGTEAVVLIERDGAGYTGNYARVQTNLTGCEGALARVRLTGLNGEILTGEERL